MGPIDQLTLESMQQHRGETFPAEHPRPYALGVQAQPHDVARHLRWRGDTGDRGQARGGPVGHHQIPGAIDDIGGDHTVGVQDRLEHVSHRSEVRVRYVAAQSKNGGKDAAAEPGDRGADRHSGRASSLTHRRRQ